MPNVLLKAHSATETVGEVVLTQGAVTKVKAQKKVNYELLREDTGRAPDHIVTKRVGNDLHVSLDKNGQSDDLIIEGYYDNADAALIGLAEDGQYYYYIPDTGEVVDYVTQLAAGDVEGQALGGQAYAAPWWVGATETKAGILPWLVGLAAIGGIAALAKDDDDDNKDTTAPGKPDVTANTDGSVTIKPNSASDVNKTTVTYTDENGTSHTATATKGSDGKWTVDDSNVTIDPNTGVITIPADKVKDGSTVTANNTDTSGNKGEDATANAATETADKPTVTPSTEDGSVKVNPGADNTKVVVKYTDEDGNQKEKTFTKEDTDGDGKPDTWKDGDTTDNVTIDPNTGEITIPQDEVQDKTKVIADSTNDRGKTNSGDGTAGKDAADKPDVTPSTDNGSVTVTPGADNTKVVVKYTDENGEEKEKTFTKEDTDGDGKPDTWTDGDTTDKVTIDPTTGVITIPQDEVKDGSTVDATGTNDAGETAKDSDKAGTDSKNAEVDNKDTDGDGKGDGVVSTNPVNEGESIETTVKLNNNNGNEALTIIRSGTTDDADFDNETYTNGVTKNADGTLNVPAGVTEFKIITPVKADGKTEGAETVKYTVGGVDGNEVTVNDTSKKAGLEIDTTPTVDNTHKQIDITGTSKGLPEGTEVTITITDSEGNKVTTTTTVDADGNYKKDDIDTSGLKDGKVTITTTAKDKDGDEAKDVDTANLDQKVPGDSDGDGETDDAGKPVVTINDGDDGKINKGDLTDGKATATITFPADSGYSVGDTLTVTYPDGTTEKFTLTDKDLKDGVTVKFTPLTEEGATNTVKAVVTDPQGNSTKEGQDDSVTDLVRPGDSDNDGDADGDDDSKDTVVIPVNPTDPTKPVEPVKPAKNTDGAPNIVFVDDANQDGKLNAKEVGDDKSVDAAITIPDGTTAGDKMVVTINGEEKEIPLTQADIDKGYITVAVPTEKDGKALDQVEVKAKVVDQQGSESQTATKTAEVDTTVPGDKDGDGKAEPADDNGKSDDTSDDTDTVIIPVKPTDPTQPVIPTPTKPTVNGAPSIVYVDDANQDGKLNAKEVGDDKSVDAAITIPDGTEAGDKMVVTINGVEQEIELKQADIDTGYITVAVPTEKDGKALDQVEVKAKVVDPAGNESQTATKTALVDTKVPGDSDGDGDADKDDTNNGAPIVHINDGDDGKINAADLTNGKATATITFPADAGYEVGDTLTVTYPDGTTEDFTLTAEDIANGKTVTFTPLAEDANNIVKAKVTDPAGNSSQEGQDSSVTDLIVEPATVIVANTVKLGDDLTDETENAESYYSKPVSNYVGEVADVGTQDYNTAVSLNTGLTNDTTPTLSFELDKAVANGQTVEVVRYTVINGNRTGDENVTAKLAVNGKSYTLTDELAQTYGTDYEYVIQLKDASGKVLSEETHAFRLDTIVEPMEVTNATFNDNTGAATVEFTSRGNSEVGATIKYKYVVAGQEITGTATDTNGDGVYSLDLQGFNRKSVDGLQLEIVDAAGNITTQKVNFVRNLFAEYNKENGPDTTARTGLAGNGGFDDGDRIAAQQPISSDPTKAILATDGNDTLVIGLEQFASDGSNIISPYTGAISDQLGKSTKVDTGAGDDFILVRGTWLAFADSDSSFSMGDGNDKLKVNGSVQGVVANAKFNVDMGEGNNIIDVKQFNATVGANVKFGSGNDLMIVHSNWDGTQVVADFGDGNNTLNVAGYVNPQNFTATFGSGDDAVIIGSNFASKKTLNVGEGDNYIEIGGYVIGSGTISAGAGNDSLIVKGNVDDTGLTMNLGDGDNYYEVGGDQRTGHFISGAGNDTVLIKGGLAYGANLGATTDSNNIDTGAGNDTVIVEGRVSRGGINLGDGDDKLVLNDVQEVINDHDVQFNGGAGNDTIVLNSTNTAYNTSIIHNFETIDMATSQAKQTLNVTINSLLDTNDSVKEIFIKGGAEDVVNLGANTSNLNDTLTGEGNVVWSKIDAKQLTVDGITYDAYTVTQSDEWVYIQQGIQVV